MYSGAIMADIVLHFISIRNFCSITENPPYNTALLTASPSVNSTLACLTLPTDSMTHISSQASRQVLVPNTPIRKYNFTKPILVELANLTYRLALHGS